MNNLQTQYVNLLREGFKDTPHIMNLIAIIDELEQPRIPTVPLKEPAPSGYTPDIEHKLQKLRLAMGIPDHTDSYTLKIPMMGSSATQRDAVVAAHRAAYAVLRFGVDVVPLPVDMMKWPKLEADLVTAWGTENRAKQVCGTIANLIISHTDK